MIPRVDTKRDTSKKMAEESKHQIAMVMIEPNTVSILSNPNIFIGYFSASTYITMYSNGMIDIHGGRDSDSIIV